MKGDSGNLGFLVLSAAADDIETALGETRAHLQASGLLETDLVES